MTQLACIGIKNPEDTFVNKDTNIQQLVYQILVP